MDAHLSSSAVRMRDHRLTRCVPLLALLLVAIPLAAGCGNASQQQRHLARPVGRIPTHRASTVRRGPGESIARACLAARRALERDEERHAYKAMRDLVGRLRRVHPPGRLGRRVGHYVRTLRQQLSVERLITAVAATNEQYPLKQLIEVREANLRRASRRLGIPNCGYAPL